MLFYHSSASCAVPIFYGSTPLYAKDKNGNIVPWNPSGKLHILGKSIERLIKLLIDDFFYIYFC